MHDIENKTSTEDTNTISERELLHRLRQRGAVRLNRVAYRRNRSTLWSLTQNGTVLNVHEAYSRAPEEVVDAFARIAWARRRTSGYRAATRTVREWPGIENALRIEIQHHRKNASNSGRLRAECAGSPEQRERLRTKYNALNRERFNDVLPSDQVLRLSDRMRSRLGHVVPREDGGVRVIDEIAINRKLLRAGNEGVFEETMLHEMAHVAAYVFDNDAGHGRAWKRWATKVGCRPRACVTLRLA